MQNLFDWLLNLIPSFADFGNWLISPLIFGLTPLSIISFNGIIAILMVWIVKFLNPLG